MFVAELETPAVVVDLDVVEGNLSRMADYCREKNIRLRPHVKTHKIPALAKWQLENGACGITVAKVGEAEVMVDAGITDVLIAYPVIGGAKVGKLAELATRCNLAVALDSVEVAEAISNEANRKNARVKVLVELDVGFRRCGIANEDDVLALAHKVDALSNLEFNGLMFFPGHLQLPEAERASLRVGVNDFLSSVQSKLQQSGLPPITISGGSTPTALESHLFVGVNETRPGMYIFNDRTMVGIGVAQKENCALSVVTTVVSTSVSGGAVIDAGSKTLSSDRYPTADGKGFGLIREDPEAELEKLSEEHGHLNISRSRQKYRVGQRLTVIPNHVCSTVNMHDQIYGVRGDRIETVWEVAGRGKVQ